VDDLDIIKENENYRVRLELDEYPEKPYDEGATPILFREFRSYGSSRWEGFNEAGEAYANALNRIWNEVPGDEEENIERYLRLFHGTYSITWDSSEYNRYVSFDTTVWRERVGLTDEWLESNTLDRQTLSEGSLTEVMAWANGDVYGYIVERRVNTVTQRTDYATGEPLEPVEFDEWVDVEDGSCWGFYGRKWAEESAIEAFDAEVNRK
jgi:hypothetical protein